MNPYIPYVARVERVVNETLDVKTFWFSTGNKIRFVPGQVIMVTAFGFGESTFGIIPTAKKNVYEFSVKKIGTVTDKIFGLKKGSFIGVRGPFGNGYPTEIMEGKNIILVAGGIGFPPIKSLLMKLLMNKKKYGKISLYYGARTPDEIVYKRELDEWNGPVDVNVTVDVGKADWKGKVGVVTKILEQAETKKSLAFLCGPPVMMKYASEKLISKGMRENEIYVSMERLMQCGIGMCGRCNLGKKYVCKHGPVFRLDELKKNTEKIW